MLWGQKIRVFTDHQNLVRDALGLTSNRVYRWRLLLEEFSPKIEYIKGITNTVADAISRLDYDPKINPDTTHSFFMRKSADMGISMINLKWKILIHHFANCSNSLPNDIVKTDNSCFTPQHVFANRDEEEEVFPLTVTEIADAQHDDENLRKILKRGGETIEKPVHSEYQVSLIEDTRVVTDKHLKMVLPKSLQKRAIMWYHYYLQHPGSTRLELTLRHTMTWHGMRTMIRNFVKKCHSCQLNKGRRLKYGKLPTKSVIRKPWEALCVDLLGPFTLKGKDGTQIEFMCLTMIDPATSWFEMVELPVITQKVTGKDGLLTEGEIFDKTSSTISNLINQSWFCRYPRCRYVIYDNGSEFKLHFQALCDSFGLKKKPTTIRNPCANAILERMHLVIENMLRTAKIDMSETITENDVAQFLSNASWAVRTTHHTILKTSPGSAIFGRDMLFDIPFIADWNKIGDYRQKQTDRNAERENKMRCDHDYAIGEQILIRKHGVLRKSESPWLGPFTITQVHTNGTIRVQRGTRSERLSIRRVTPYYPSGKNSTEN